MSDAVIRVLVVGDTAGGGGTLRNLVSSPDTRSGLLFTSVSGVETAGRTLAADASDACDVVLLDASRDGTASLRRHLEALDAFGPHVPVIVVARQDDDDEALALIGAGVAEVVDGRHLTLSSLSRAIRHSLARCARAPRSPVPGAASPERRLQLLIENGGEAVVLLDAERSVTALFGSAETQLGSPAAGMLGRPLLDYVHEADRQLLADCLAEAARRPGMPVALAVRFRHADDVWLGVEGVAVDQRHDPSMRAVVLNLRNAIDRRRIEQQLLGAHRMETVGQLAGGVAHDFNNLLTAILGYCNLILDDLPDGHAVRHDVTEIKRAGERAALMTRQLLAFSRRQMLQPQTVDLNDLVRQMDERLRGLVGDDIRIEMALADQLPPVVIDPASVGQVLMNITDNARDAMPGGGRMRIETGVVDFDRAAADAHHPMAPGRYVHLSMSDTGLGMDEGTRARVFEPFFTTKEQGKGTGLGLSTVFGIVKQSNGFIFVTTATGQGTTFRIFLSPARPVA